MATFSSNPSTFVFYLSNFTQLIYVKLDGSNYLVWLAQFLAILRSHDLLGLVDGSKPFPPQYLSNTQGSSSLNPTFISWTKRNQYLLSWINATLFEKVLATIYGLNTSRQVWLALANKFASQSCSHISHLKRQLLSLHQGPKSCSEYLHTAKLWADWLAIKGNPIDDENLISLVINCLNFSFNNFITSFSFATRDNAFSLVDFQVNI